MAYHTWLTRFAAGAVRAVADRARRARAALRRWGVCSATVGAVATLVVIGGWRVYERWRTGRIELTTTGEPLLVQVLGEEGDTPIGEAFDLARRAVVELPEGEYRLRVNGKGRLGRTYRFAVNRGETQSHRISIPEGRLLSQEGRPAIEGEPPEYDEPAQLPRMTRALELTKGKTSLIGWSDSALICREGASGTIVWDALHPSMKIPVGRDPREWLHMIPREERRGLLVARATELDGDGTRDLVWYFPDVPALLALSGDDGSLLWNQFFELAPARATLDMNKRAQPPAETTKRTTRSSVSRR
jgi:hypothetical protein